MRNNAFNSVRSIVAALPKLGIVRKPVYNKEGISVIIPVKDEERWIKQSILSIEPIANEIIIIDGSVEDGTTKIIEDLATSIDKIKHFKFYGQGRHVFALSCHIGLTSANYRWIFKWDADHIAKSTDGLMDWRNRLLRLDKNTYYVIDVPRINLEGDLFHQPKACPINYENRLFTYSPDLNWKLKSNDCEQVCGDSIWGHRFPPWYKRMRWHEHYIFHCNIKSSRRMLMRLFWMDYGIERSTNKFPNLESYTAYRVQKDWNMSIEDAEKVVMDKVKQDLIPYDESSYGSLPDILIKMRQ